MITNETTRRCDTKLTTTETHEYHFDARNQAHTAGLLREMYSDPVLATVREVGANALDAHIFAGKLEEPIKVVLPSRFNSVFVIRDYGKGLTEEETKELLFGYGASGDHKRVSNSYTGGFGIGAKSCFSITDQFTYKIYHNGTVTTWLNYLNATNKCLADKVGVEPTTEPDGILVEVPVKEDLRSNFISICQSVFKWYPTKPRFYSADAPEAEIAFNTNDKPEPDVQGELSVFIEELDRHITVRWLIPKDRTHRNSYSYGSGQCRVVMGPIEYPVDYSTLKQKSKGHAHQLPANCPDLVLITDVGFVQVSPSREALQYSLATVDRLYAAFQGIKAQLTKTLKEVCEQPNTTIKELYTHCSGAFDTGMLTEADITKALSQMKNKLGAWVSFSGGDMQLSLKNFPPTLSVSERSMYGYGYNRQLPDVRWYVNRPLTDDEKTNRTYGTFQNLGNSFSMQRSEVRCLYTDDAEAGRMIGGRKFALAVAWDLHKNVPKLDSNNNTHVVYLHITGPGSKEYVESIPWVKDGTVLSRSYEEFLTGLPTDVTSTDFKLLFGDYRFLRKYWAPVVQAAERKNTVITDEGDVIRAATPSITTKLFQINTATTMEHERSAAKGYWTDLSNEQFKIMCKDATDKIPYVCVDSFYWMKDKDTAEIASKVRTHACLKELSLLLRTPILAVRQKDVAKTKWDRVPYSALCPLFDYMEQKINKRPQSVYSDECFAFDLFYSQIYSEGLVTSLRYLYQKHKIICEIQAQNPTGTHKMFDRLRWLNEALTNLFSGMHPSIKRTLEKPDTTEQTVGSLAQAADADFEYRQFFNYLLYGEYRTHLLSDKQIPWFNVCSNSLYIKDYIISAYFVTLYEKYCTKDNSFRKYYDSNTEKVKAWSDAQKFSKGFVFRELLKYIADVKNGFQTLFLIFGLPYSSYAHTTLSLNLLANSVLTKNRFLATIFPESDLVFQIK